MFPQSLRGRLMILVVVLVSLPIIASGFCMTISAEQALVEEKQQKLFGAARMLDLYLNGNYEDILQRRKMERADRAQQIAALNQELQEYTDKVALAYPGIGVGYYARDLDAIVTYGPSEVYADKVGMKISESHEGRLVMETGVHRVQVGDLVRGPIMNAMHPIIRGGRVIGYIWANELTADITAQVLAMKRQLYLTVLGALLISLVVSAYLVRQLMADIDAIKDGVFRLRHDLNKPVPVAAGEMGEIAEAINAMAFDLAARKELEQQVQRAERLAAIGEMAAGLAHEIRNPLMAIKGFAQLMKEDITPIEQAEYSAIIVKETERLNRLMEQLLCFARPAGTYIAPTDIGETLLSTLQLVETKAIENHIEITYDIANTVPLALVDGEQLKQVLLNIIINAIQAIDVGGSIHISIADGTGDSSIIVNIADSGCGMSSETVERIFNPFFTTKEYGTGLGLAVAHRLVENWGGLIMANSTEGVGSTFTLVLPVARSEDNGSQPPCVSC